MTDYYPQEQVQSSTLAIVSLVAGILSWFLLPLIGSIVAVVTGHMAKREIRESLGKLSGDGMATAGLILGYVQLALIILGICAGILIFIFMFTIAGN
ncbi:MAG: DUF4190 domain-containing protein [Anaerolineales bacterium]|nr:DUF4190 domain-containing protein [Anaerolineales bacterium]